LGKRHYILLTILILFDDGENFDVGAGGDEDEDWSLWCEFEGRRLS
jgi:hypothetical protein